MRAFADTNILISHLILLQQTIASLTQHHVSTATVPSLTFIIPSVTILELDGLKNSRRFNPHGPSVADLARSATKWLLSVVPRANPKASAACFVRGQQKQETLIAGGEEGRRRVKREGGAGGNDSLVLDAVAYFNGLTNRAVLLTDDKNLRLRASIDGIEAMGVSTGWNSMQFLTELDPGWKTSAVSHSPVMVPVPLGPPPRQTSRNNSLRTPSPVPQRKNTPPTPTDHLPPLSCPSPRRSPRPFVSQPMEVDFEPAPISGAFARPADVLRATCAAFGQLLAAPVFRHLAGDNLPSASDAWPAGLDQWYERLGGLQARDGSRCARVLRNEWNDGAIAELCQRGLDARKRNDGAAAKSRTKRPAVVLQSLRNLEQHWATAAQAECDAWSGGRWDVVVDEVHEVLGVFLTGLHPSVDMAGDLSRIVGDWKAQLRGMGVRID